MKTNRQILALAGLFAALTVSAGNNFPNRIKLGAEPTFNTKPSTQAMPRSTSSAYTKAGYNDGAANQVVKMNLSQIAFRNLSFQYEYGFHKNFSGALGVSFMLKRPFPGFFTEDDPTGEGLRNPMLKGWAITPEFRYYVGRKEEKQAPRGFYLAAYFRYAQYTMTSNYTENFSNGKTYGYDYELTYKGYTAGLMIGQQWVIGKHFSIDWWIIGGGAGKAKLSMEAVGSGFVMTQQEQDEVAASVEKEFEDATLLGFSTNVTTTSNSVKAVVSGLPMLSVRAFGLCLGFAF